MKNKIIRWLYSKILTYPMFKLMRAHKYSEVQKRK